MSVKSPLKASKSDNIYCLSSIKFHRDDGPSYVLPVMRGNIEIKYSERNQIFDYTVTPRRLNGLTNIRAMALSCPTAIVT